MPWVRNENELQFRTENYVLISITKCPCDQHNNQFVAEVKAHEFSLKGEFTEEGEAIAWAVGKLKESPSAIQLILEPSHCAVERPGQLYTVRHYDGFDNDWIDILANVPYLEARKCWNESTKFGTELTRFNDIDYYDIFESDTRMVFRDRGGYPR